MLPPPAQASVVAGGATTIVCALVLVLPFASATVSLTVNVVSAVAA